MAEQPFKLGVFMPVANNGWIISKTAPQYVPSFELNKKIAQFAEGVGFDYVFSMAKWTGYGGETEYWDHSIESFTLMTALAPVTERLRLVASIAPVLIHPTIVAKMAVTLDDVSGGRLGINLVSSDHEYIRMGLYPDDFYSYRHEYMSEWLDIAKRLWQGETVDFQGTYFSVSGYASKPPPVQEPWPSIVYATSSDGGYEFVANHCDEAFLRCDEKKNPTSKWIKQLARERGRSVKTQAHVCLIQGEDDADAQRILGELREGADYEAISNVYDVLAYEGDKVARGKELLEQRFPRTLFYHAFPLIGGPRLIADFIEDMAVNGDFDGMLFSFPDYIEGLTQFDRHVMPLLKERGLRV
ncbi:MAG TPA: LLM class flavin-dependent oxidoreductase [Chloroflexota bacterium]